MVPVSPKTESRIGTADDVAPYLKMNRRTVLSLAARGELPAVRIGKLWRFNLVAIEKMFDDAPKS